MISIDQNFNIEASQYDTYTLRFAFKDYVLTADDMFRFSIKATSNSTDVVFSKDVYHAGYNYIDLSIELGGTRQFATRHLCVRCGTHQQKDTSNQDAHLDGLFHD